ncbi:hypothetical protein PENSPDRAFT_658687 [Peniophora sp. CONT]|nr:hypothetical protein PENSPDRAFT_658687 [Peniophora sp. CONT]
MEHTNDTIGSLVEDVVARRLKSFEALHATAMLRSDAHIPENTLLADIDSLRSIVARFTQQLNHIRSPILRLPAEIFQLVIRTTVQLIEEEDNYEDRDPRRWILLDRVSHRFRVMLLAMHTLWGDTVSSTHLPNARQFLLERAQNAPITLDIGTYETSPETDDFALRHLEQARAITAYNLERPYLRPLLEKLIAGTLPHLESLHLYAYEATELLPGESAIRVMGLHRTGLPFHQSAICAPKLRSLSLSSTFIPFKASSLTQLALHRRPDTRTEELLPFGHFMEMLRHCVNVQDLELSHYLPTMPSSAISLLSDHIHLPALKSIFIADTRNRILPFWSLIEVPASTILKLNTWPSQTSSKHTFTSQINYTSVFASHILSPHFPSSTRLEIQGSGFDATLSFDLMIPHNGPSNRYTKHTEHPRHASSPHMSILQLSTYSDDWDVLDVKQSIQMFVSAYHLSQIQSLEVPYFVLGALGDAPQSLLALFPSLETLSIYDLQPEFFRTFAGGQSPPPSHPFQVLLHPKVHSLSLSSEAFTLTLEDASKLAALLTSRLEHRIPIHALELEFSREETGSESENELPDPSQYYHDMLVNLVVPGPLTVKIDW